MESKISLPVQTWLARVIAKLIHQSLKQWTSVHFSLKNPTKNPSFKIYIQKPDYLNHMKINDKNFLAFDNSVR